MNIFLNLDLFKIKFNENLNINACIILFLVFWFLFRSMLNNVSRSVLGENIAIFFEP